MLNLKNCLSFVPVFAVCAAFFSPSSAARADAGVTLKVGTLGVGADLTLSLADQWNLRVGGNFFQYTHYNTTYSNINYTGSLTLESELTTVDWYPFSSAFHISGGGLLFDGNKFHITANSTGGTYTINGNTYTAAQVGTLTVNSSFNSAAPYLGVGWGNAVAKGSNWSLAFDLGLAYQGNPKVTYSATGAAGNPALTSDLNAQRAKTQHDFTSLSYYPVFSGGISYKF
jgi:hypothetical protein